MSLVSPLLDSELLESCRELYAFSTGQALLPVLHPLLNSRPPLSRGGHSPWPARAAGCGSNALVLGLCGAAAVPGPGPGGASPQPRPRVPRARRGGRAGRGGCGRSRTCPAARPGCSVRPLPAAAPGQSGPGGTRRVCSGEGTAGWATGPWETSSGVFAARRSVQQLRAVSIFTDFGVEEL